jgi:phospholipid-binding lipoprotein MlaA
MPMPFLPRLASLSRLAPLLALTLLVGCTIAKPRTDDPLEKFNRKSYAFNDKLDKAVVRPVTVGYRKITNQPVRDSISDFFTNIHMPITIANDLLQARPKQAVEGTGRLLVNLTLGIGGFFDPATKMGIPLNETDFGITLARWGMPEGDFLMLPLLGPTTMRDVWRYPVDGYFFDPLSYFERNHGFKDGQYYIPQVVYFISLRSQLMDAEGFLKSAYDPYAFLRDAYRQRRIYQIYDGNPPNSVIDEMQGVNQDNFDPEQLLEQQKQWEKQQKQGGGKPTDNNQQQQQ